MIQVKSIVLRALLLSIPLAAAVAVTAPSVAEAQVVVVPPAEFIAGATPEYYGGRAHYWYNNQWYYRDAHGAWNYYRSEPAYLRDRRAHWPADRGHYHYRR